MNELQLAALRVRQAYDAAGEHDAIRAVLGHVLFDLLVELGVEMPPSPDSPGGHIEIRRWFDGVSTYYSSRVHFIDSDGFASVRVLAECEYGYGNHGLSESCKALGVPSTNKLAAYGYTDSVVDVTRKGDL